MVLRNIIGPNVFAHENGTGAYEFGFVNSQLVLAIYRLRLHHWCVQSS